MSGGRTPYWHELRPSTRGTAPVGGFSCIVPQKRAVVSALPGDEINGAQPRQRTHARHPHHSPPASAVDDARGAATGAVPYGRQVLQAARIGPDKDVQWLPIGNVIVVHEGYLANNKETAAKVLAASPRPPSSGSRTLGRPS